MKIATWNVNSVRTRLAHVTAWLTASSADVLCLQETKVTDDLFPQAAFAEVGYRSYVYGQKSYNGVALLSRLPLDAVQMGFGAVLPESLVGDLDEQKRVITGVIAGIQVVNLYVPNGSSLDSDKYIYKLRWLKVLREYLQVLLAKSPSLLVCGDFNVALEDIDIHNPKGREKQVMATDAEREALSSVLELGLCDGFRKFTTEGGYFSWWDYRSGAFRRDAGWRIDHHYLTPDLYDRAISCVIDKEPRKLEQPSDHAPVIVEF
ncbi:exodeoxyribonuclease III [Myxacorys almedinensis]|uniref:Exodeoxyribonuclease III n=1 Tax=Myxacorys almedinensis A TaxID=2690445 RepID=A0A8J8CLR5_9CYAN|nr:exodeoxyribonuclease III [Myxacorys almedinensis]NDJ16412.1 exodeoxyribonuclease III [Myxacorys almedinensis A]